MELIAVDSFQIHSAEVAVQTLWAEAGMAGVDSPWPGLVAVGGNLSVVVGSLGRIH